MPCPSSHSVSERVPELGLALAVAFVGGRPQHDGPRLACASGEGIHVAHMQMEQRRRAAQGEGAEPTVLRPLLGQHERRRAEPELGMRDAAVLAAEPKGSSAPNTRI